MLTVPNAREWSPEDPVLYDLRFRLTGGDGVVDRVSSYLGLREVHIVGNKILFNNKTRFLRLVLDKGYYPDGIYTAPSDEALRKDIEISKEMGFDGARLHQKVFEPRFLYWADKLGYPVTGEFADWGVELSKDKAKGAFLDEWVEVLQRDINHPSIIIWTPLNERVFIEGDRSIEFLENMFNVTKFIDPSRPVIDTSGYTHVKTEIYDIHDYEQDIEKFLSHYEISTLDYDTAFKWRKFQNYQQNIPYTGSPIFVSEYGGIWWHPEKKEEKSWGYGEKPKSFQEFTDRYMSLTNILLSNSNICGFCYTQLYDIEQETNGLYSYDRKRKINPEIIFKINQQKSAIEKENN